MLTAVTGTEITLEAVENVSHQVAESYGLLQQVVWDGSGLIYPHRIGFRFKLADQCQINVVVGSEQSMSQCLLPNAQFMPSGLVRCTSMEEAQS